MGGIMAPFLGSEVVMQEVLAVLVQLPSLVRSRV